MSLSNQALGLRLLISSQTKREVIAWGFFTEPQSGLAILSRKHLVQPLTSSTWSVEGGCFIIAIILNVITMSAGPQRRMRSNRMARWICSFMVRFTAQATCVISRGFTHTHTHTHTHTALPRVLGSRITKACLCSFRVCDQKRS